MDPKLEAFLLTREAENNLFLGSLARFTPSSYLAQVERAGQVKAAALFVERNLILAGAPEYVAELIPHDREIPAVIGPISSVERFLELWAHPHKLSADQTIYQVTQVATPPSPGGEMRPVEARDAKVLTEWLEYFQIEALPDEPLNRDHLQRNAFTRRSFFWIEGNQPRAMAALTRPTPNGICLSYVFTPPDQRGRGYAAAISAAVSQVALKEGKSFCMLYADLANPGANRIYQRIGYQAVAGSRNYRFLKSSS